MGSGKAQIPVFIPSNVEPAYSATSNAYCFILAGVVALNVLASQPAVAEATCILRETFVTIIPYRT